MSLIRSQNNLYPCSLFFQDSKIATGNPRGVFLLFLSFFLYYISSKLDFPAFLLPHISIISVNAHNKTSDIFIEVLTLFAIMQQILSLHLIQRSLKTIQTANFCRRTVCQFIFACVYCKAFFYNENLLCFPLHTSLRSGCVSFENCRCSN